jgi:hypothetical protein
MTAEEISPDAVVQIPVRDMLAEQTALLRSIDTKVDSKMDRADGIALAERLNGHGDRILTLENWRTTNTRFFAGAGVLGMIVATIIGALIASHVI